MNLKEESVMGLLVDVFTKHWLGRLEIGESVCELAEAHFHGEIARLQDVPDVSLE